MTELASLQIKPDSGQWALSRARHKAHARRKFDELYKNKRREVADGTATAKAIDYSLGRWAALIRYLDDGDLPIDNNHLENRIRPVAVGRSNWMFAGSLRAGQRAANVMTLVQSAKLNELDPYIYLTDVLKRLPTQPTSRLDDLMPHRWMPLARDAH
jgi:transposase